jgi:hypothetical protein
MNVADDGGEPLNDEVIKSERVELKRRLRLKII